MVCYKGELARQHLSHAKDKINWTNCTWRDWWREPWEVAKLFMADLGTRKGDVKDALSTDLGGLMNLLEWCPFIAPPVNQGVVIKVRQEVRNLWAHAPNQELSNIEKTAAEGYLRDLLNDPVFAGDRVAQDALKDLTDVFRDALAIVRETELKVLTELRNALAVDLAALMEARKVSEKVDYLQSNLLCVARDVNNLDFASRQREEEILKLGRELSSCIHRMDQVILSVFINSCFGL